MINAILEHSLAGFLSEWLRESGRNEAVRTSFSDEEIPPFQPFLIASVSPVEREVGPLLLAEVSVSVRSPFPHVTIDDHRAICAVLRQALTNSGFAGLAVAIWEDSGVILAGHHVTGFESQVERGQWVSELRFRLGLYASGDPILDGSHSPVPGLTAADVLASLFFGDGFRVYPGGDSRFIDARSRAVTVEVPAANFQAIIPFNSPTLIDGDGGPRGYVLTDGGPDIRAAVKVTFPAGSFGVASCAALAGTPRIKVL